MGRVVAISGGDLLSTKELNKYTIKLTNKMNPNLLFIGTASHDAEGYIDVITKAFIQLNCEVKYLCLCLNNYSNEEIDSILAWADIIYVGGGDTIFMMQMWKKYRLDEKLKQIYQKDLAVLTGISAGAICWFNCGHSDSEYFQNSEKWNYCWANGMLNIFHAAFCPHYNEDGRNSFDKMLKEKNMPGLAMENNTAFVENKDEHYFIRSLENANAYLLEYVDGIMKKQAVIFRSIS